MASYNANQFAAMMAAVSSEWGNFYDAMYTAVPVEQIYAAKPFKSAPAKGMSWSSRPAIIKQVYQRAEPPPALHKLNCFRFVQAICICFYCTKLVKFVITDHLNVLDSCWFCSF